MNTPRDSQSTGGTQSQAPSLRYLSAAELFARLDAARQRVGADADHSRAIDELERRREWLRDSQD